MAEYRIPTEDEYENRKFEQEDLQKLREERERTLNAKVSADEPRKDWFDPTQNKRLTVDLVDKWHDMDPETDDLLFDGTELVEGMVVLIADPKMRVDIRYPLSPKMLYRARTWNRWFVVSHLSISDSDKTVIMMANYEDGSKRKIETQASLPWISKFGRPVVGLPIQNAVGRVSVDENVYGQRRLPILEEDFSQERLGTWNHDHRRPIQPNNPYTDIPKISISDDDYQPETLEDRWHEEKGTDFPKGPFQPIAIDPKLLGPNEPLH